MRDCGLQFAEIRRHKMRFSQPGKLNATSGEWTERQLCLEGRVINTHPSHSSTNMLIFVFWKPSVCLEVDGRNFTHREVYEINTAFGCFFGAFGPFPGCSLQSAAILQQEENEINFLRAMYFCFSLIFFSSSPAFSSALPPVCLLPPAFFLLDFFFVLFCFTICTFWDRKHAHQWEQTFCGTLDLALGNGGGRAVHSTHRKCVKKRRRTGKLTRIQGTWLTSEAGRRGRKKTGQTGEAGKSQPGSWDG